MKVRNFMIPLLLMAAVSCTITPTAAPALAPKPTRVKPTTTPSPTSCPKPAYYAILDELAGCWVEVSSERTEVAEKICKA